MGWSRSLNRSKFRPAPNEKWPPGKPMILAAGCKIALRCQNEARAATLFLLEPGKRPVSSADLPFGKRGK